MRLFRPKPRLLIVSRNPLDPDAIRNLREALARRGNYDLVIDAAPGFEVYQLVEGRWSLIAPHATQRSESVGTRTD